MQILRGQLHSRYKEGEPALRIVTIHMQELSRVSMRNWSLAQEVEEKNGKRSCASGRHSYIICGNMASNHNTVLAVYGELAEVPPGRYAILEF